MSLEIERKFLCLLTEDQARAIALNAVAIESIYLYNNGKTSVRLVKDTFLDTKIVECKWTEKKATDNPTVRIENEKIIPTQVFDSLKILGSPSIKKTRYMINMNGRNWEVDFFKDYEFVIAELEFDTAEEAEAFDDLPEWITTEVTKDPYYLNCNLAKV